MAVTTIGWTGTPLTRALALPRDLRLDDDEVLAAGTYSPGYILPGFTFNPWIGCQKIRRACRNCYAEALVTGRMGYNPTSNDPRRRLSVWGPPATSTRVRTSKDNWKKPLRWDRLAAELGVRFKVFCASLADVGEDNPLVRAWRQDLFELIDATPYLDWLLLTKRAEVLGAEWPRAWRVGAPPHNVWVGATVEEQAVAEECVPLLLDIPAVVHWLSCEPLVGPLDLTRFLAWLDWVVVGGESGSEREELDLASAEALIAQVLRAKKAGFFKQDSGLLPGRKGRASDALWAIKQWPEVRDARRAA